MLSAKKFAQHAKSVTIRLRDKAFHLDGICNASELHGYCIYLKYWDTLMSYQTDPKNLKNV